MESEPSSRPPLITATIRGAALVSILALFLHLDLTPPVFQHAVTAEQARSLQPIRLIIPKIQVDAAVESVGLTAEGSMDVPKYPSNVAWLNSGPLPGQVGTAVIDGHFGWSHDIPAVFDDLSSLHPGDKLSVVDAAGVKTTFVVREVRTYGEHDDTSAIFVSDDGNAHLNLITCEGVWNPKEKSYSDRLVIFTDERT